MKTDIFLCLSNDQKVWKQHWWLKVEFESKTWHMPQIKNNWSDRVLNWNNDKCYLCSLPVYLDGKTLRKITISLDQWLITINPIVLFPCLSLTNLSSSLYNNPKLFRQSSPIWSRQCNLSLPPFKLTSELLGLLSIIIRTENRNVNVFNSFLRTPVMPRIHLRFYFISAGCCYLFIYLFIIYYIYDIYHKSI